MKTTQINFPARRILEKQSQSAALHFSASNINITEKVEKYSIIYLPSIWVFDVTCMTQKKWHYCTLCTVLGGDCKSLDNKLSALQFL